MLFVSDVWLLMLKHFLLYLENYRSWLGTKIFLLSTTCSCIAYVGLDTFHLTQLPPQIPFL